MTKISDEKIATESINETKIKKSLKPHPLLYPMIGVFVLIFLFFFYTILLNSFSSPLRSLKCIISEPIGAIFYFLLISAAGIFYSLILFTPFFIFFKLIINLGADSDDCRLDDFRKERCWRKKEKEWIIKQITYRDVFRWATKGCCVIISFFIWKMWIKLAIKIWRLVCSLANFSYRFFIKKSRINIKK